MTLEIKDEPAFPWPGAIAYMQPSLSKRELFAAMAMQGLLRHDCDNYDYYAAESVRFADALLRELGKNGL